MCKSINAIRSRLNYCRDLLSEIELPAKGPYSQRESKILLFGCVNNLNCIIINLKGVKNDRCENQGSLHEAV